MSVGSNISLCELRDHIHATVTLFLHMCINIITRWSGWWSRFVQSQSLRRKHLCTSAHCHLLAGWWHRVLIRAAAHYSRFTVQHTHTHTHTHTLQSTLPHSGIRHPWTSSWFVSGIMNCNWALTSLHLLKSRPSAVCMMECWFQMQIPLAALFPAVNSFIIGPGFELRTRINL